MIVFVLNLWHLRSRGSIRDRVPIDEFELVLFVPLWVVGARGVFTLFSIIVNIFKSLSQFLWSDVDTI